MNVPHAVIALLAALLAAPIGAAGGVVCVYVALVAIGMGEKQGRRGLLTFVLGAPVGAVAGIAAGLAIARTAMIGADPAWRLAAHVAIALLAATIAGAAGLVLGIGWAEDRGVPSYAGARGAWALFYVAIPAFVVGGAAMASLIYWMRT